MKRFKSFQLLGFAALALGLIVWSAADARNGRSKNALNSASANFISARLVDKTKNAANRTATVEVTVRGVRLVDPAFASQVPGSIQGHLLFQLDGGPIIATPTSRLSFRELAPGEHTISVNLADDHHMPMGLPVLLTVSVPAPKTVLAY
ncbi:MAG TPA: hypothetical protein VLJ37_10795 [bacterium]|nr:hypothetical protein [bacterium]